MNDTGQVIEHTEQLLARVEEMLRQARLLIADLSQQSVLLQQQLNTLQQTTAGPETADKMDLEEAEPDDAPRSDRVEQFLAAATSARERRSEQRRRGNLKSVQVRAEENAEPFEGWVLDRSPGGLGLLVDEQMPVGTVLSVRPHRCSPKFPWIPVEVRSCRPHQQSWNLGCQFLQRVSWNELRLFG